MKMITVKLKELAEITMGVSPKSCFYNTEGKGLPFLQGNRTFGDKYPAFDTFTQNTTKIAPLNSVLMSVRAPVGDINITKQQCCIGRGLCCLVSKENNNEFLYYLLKLGSNRIKNYETGTTFGSINSDIIHNLEFTIPEDKKVRLKISNFLSLFDEKIESNNAINDNLQEQAFLHFNKLLQGKEADTCLSNYVCLNPNRQLPKGKIARCIDMSKLSTSGTFPSGWEYKEYNGGMKFCNGDTILARITPCLENGKTALINFLDSDEVAFGSTEYIVLSPKFPYVSPGFVYCLSRYTPFVDYAVKNMNGSSGRQRVSAETISQFSLPAISEMEFKTFGKITNPLFQLMLCNSIESIRLAGMRDELLPRLLQGDIEIN